MKTVLSIGALAIVLLLAGCAEQAGGPAPGSSASSGAALAGVVKITAEEAKQRMEDGNVTIVDVRTEEEYREGHVPGAVLVPNETIGGTLPEALPDQDAELLVYCRTGRRSKEASEKLAALGYQNVYDFGGITDWPYDTVSEAE